ncbi:MAG: YrdB family protein [Bacteroidales bacterium]
MGKHPLNLAFRFLLEITALVSLGTWGYDLFDHAPGIIAAVIFPLLFALIWGVFAVKGDPSRSGKTVVNTPGPVRLVLEIILFGVAVFALYKAEFTALAIIFAVALVVHYLLSWDRVKWLVTGSGV